jgi:hypothetical protein
MKKTIALAAIAVAMLAGCVPDSRKADAIQADQQEVLIKEATAQTGMPAIKNFRERRLLKMIYELRDQEGLTTFSYTVSSMTGKLTPLCQSIGYAISDATGYTNPDKVVRDNAQVFGTMTQAEPNGLYTPDTSDANWVVCTDPSSGKSSPVFVSTPIVVSPFRLAL